VFLGQVEYLDETQTRSKILVRRNLTIWRAAIYCTLVVLGYLCCYVAVNVGLQAARDGKGGLHDDTIA
jgi:hypothetical protein